MHPILPLIDVVRDSTPLLIDSAVKGTVLLVLALAAVGLLRRDSAATRHFVWLLSLTLARESSLENRLISILSQHLNRRRVSAALGSIGVAIATTVVVPMAMLRATDDQPAEQVSREHQTTNKEVSSKPELSPGIPWGEPSNGLRAALVVHRASDKPDANEDLDFYLAVQNVSSHIMDLNYPTEVSLPFELKIKSRGATKLHLKNKTSLPEFVRLEPHAVTLIRLIPPDNKAEDGRPVGSTIVQDLITDPQLTAVAEMTREQAPKGLWTGKLVTGELNGLMARRPQPRNIRAHELFIKWQEHARMNTDLPGGLLDRLGSRVREFVRLNPSYSDRMQPVIGRFDASRDWKSAEVVSLFDDIAAVHDLPFMLGGRGLSRSWEGDDYAFRTGAPLPPELADSPWGPPQPNGLRMAWRLEPFAREFHLGTLLELRVLFHNSGKETIVFRAPEWIHARMEIRDAQGEPIEYEYNEWLGIVTLAPFRLAPGDFIEMPGSKMVIGRREDYGDGDRRFNYVAYWIDARPGDEVTLAPGSVAVKDRQEPEPVDGLPGWWPKWIAERLSRDLPLPASAEERTRILDRVTRYLFGTAPTAGENAAFVKDSSSNALESLQQRLRHRRGLTAFTGELKSGPTKFRVLPPDPEEAKRPRATNDAGRFRLGKNTWFVVRRRGEGKRIINEAGIQFGATDEDDDGDDQIPKHKLKLPDGEASWSSAWIRDSNVLWILQKDFARKYDFSNPTNIKETTIDRAQIRKQIPLSILKALHTEGPFDLLELPK